MNKVALAILAATATIFCPDMLAFTKSALTNQE